MARDHLGPDDDRMLAGRLTSIAQRHAQRHARWGAATEDEVTAGAAELREIASGRVDLLAEAPGLALGTAGGKGREYAARAQAVAGLCRQAGADQDLIPEWAEEGWRRAEERRMPRSASLVVHRRAPECQPAQDGP